MKNRIKISLFIVFCLVLILPLIYSFMKLNSKIKLKGAVVLSEKPSLDSNTWFENSFQKKYEGYINDNIGFRPIFVRIRNQISYTLWGEAKAAGVIEGKEKHLYERNYIKAYNGEDFIGTDSITKNVIELKTVQDSLAELGKTLLICLAPGKGSFYPEYFPDKFIMPKTETTNYNLYRKLLIERGVNHIDFNQWFLEIKEDSKYILYPKYGIHWSYYGMLLATDSLIHHVEKLRNDDLPDLKIGKYHLSRRLDRMDYDIADGMNLLWQLPSEPMCYPEFEWEEATDKTKIKTIVIGDSFYWSMFQLGLWTKSFSPGGFWFYNRKIYPDSFEQELLVEDVDMKEAINQNEMIILLVTEANLPKFPWGFTQNVLNTYKSGNSSSRKSIISEKEYFKNELQKHIKNIRGNKKWMMDIKEKARNNNISVDSMLVLDAKWMMEFKKKKPDNKN